MPPTSAYDRAKAEQGSKLPSAAFDLKPVTTEEAGRKIRETPVDELREQRKTKRRNPTGRRIRRDGWLSPMTLAPTKLSDQPQVHTGGVRSSDRGFLNIAWKDYWRLLRWTAKQSVDGMSAKVPAALAQTLGELGIDVSMWRDLVWNWQKYFGKSVCVGRPESMRQHAESTGRHHHRGQASVADCFAQPSLSTLALAACTFRSWSKMTGGVASAECTPTFRFAQAAAMSHRYIRYSRMRFAFWMMPFW